MSGKLIGSFIVITALIFGAVVYYFQEYGYYEEIAVNGRDDVVLTSLGSGLPEAILYEDFRAIDADSSPIRYRACFTTEQSIPLLTETYVGYQGAEPRNGPAWFDCFDAAAIGKALESGEALAFLSQQNIHYGIDRVAAIFPDGRGYVWHQFNHCGEVVFDGKPVPEGCPPKPDDMSLPVGAPVPTTPPTTTGPESN